MYAYSEICLILVSGVYSVSQSQLSALGILLVEVQPDQKLSFGVSHLFASQKLSKHNARFIQISFLLLDPE